MKKQKVTSQTISPSKNERIPILKSIEPYGLWIVVLFSLVAILLQFDAKFSTGGDDSSYVLRANEWLKSGTYPGSYQAPLYPFILAFFISLFDLNILILKLTSVAFLTLGFAYFYQTLRLILPFSVSILITFWLILTPTLMEFGSLTYTESFFFFVQSIALFSLLKYESDETNWLTILKNLLPLILLTFTLAWIRTSGGFMVIAILSYFLWVKQWKSFSVYLVGFSFMYGCWKLCERLIWDSTGGGQVNQIFLKNFYNPQDGNETFFGFFQRLWDNSYTYLSQIIWDIQFQTQLQGQDPKFILFLLGGGLLIVGSIVLWRQSHKFIPIILFAWIFFLLIGITIQQNWASPRLIITIYPILLTVILGGIYFLLHKNKKWIFIIVSLICTGYFFIQSTNKISTHFPTVKRNLSGDMYAGFSPDWINFLKASEWVGKNLPDSVVVASRKESMFYIYAGGHQQAKGIYRVYETEPRAIISFLKSHEITHILYDSFTWSGTLRRFLQPAIQQYPTYFKVIYSEGNAQNNPCYVLEFTPD